MSMVLLAAGTARMMGCGPCEINITPEPSEPPEPETRVEVSVGYPGPTGSSQIPTVYRQKLPFAVNARVENGAQVAKVEWWVDGQSVGSEENKAPAGSPQTWKPDEKHPDRIPKWSWSFRVVKKIDTAAYPDGSHTLKAIITNGVVQAGNSVDATFDNTVPSLDLHTPADQASLNPGLWVEVAVKDGDQPPPKLELELNGVTAWSGFPMKSWVAFPELPEGEYELAVRATDAAGNSARKAVTVRK